MANAAQQPPIVPASHAGPHGAASPSKAPRPTVETLPGGHYKVNFPLMSLALFELTGALGST